MTTKMLAFGLNPSTRMMQLVPALILREIVMRWRIPSSGFVQVFAESFIKVPSLESEYEVVEYDAGTNKNDCPFVVLQQGNFNVQFA
jgi:hypothetical protein